MAGYKRGADDVALVPVKRSRPAPPSMALAKTGPTKIPVARTSSLQAPIMLLTGHGGEVYSAKFSPSGRTVASAGHDRQIYFWNTFGECENYAVLSGGHTGAILDLQWTSDGSHIYTMGSDKAGIVWDADTGDRVRRLRGHKSIINSCSPLKDSTLLATGSDDTTVKIWDSRRRLPVHSLNSKFPVTAVAYSNEEHQIFSGGLDNSIKVWDVRKLEVDFEIAGHTDTVTSLALSPDGKHLLSNAMDNTVCMWDVRPFAKERLERQFVGSQHNYEKNLISASWHPSGMYVGAGSADRNVLVWDAITGQIKYCLPGHKGVVNDVQFHPEEPIVLSCSSDKRLFLGELKL